MYMSDSDNDEDFVATASDLADAAAAAALPEEDESDIDEDSASCNSDDSGQEEIGLALAGDMLPVDVSIPCLNTKASWGRGAATIATRKCKISAAHCPPGGKVAVTPIEDLLPTSGGLQLDLDGLWATATRGTTIDRYLLVAMELNDGPENANWRLWQLPMVTDQRLVKEIVETSGVEFTDDLKKKLVAASDPANRSLSKLPVAVSAAFEKYGGLVYSSATFHKMKPRAAATAAAAAPPAATTTTAPPATASPFKKPATPKLPPKKRKATSTAAGTLAGAPAPAEKPAKRAKPAPTPSPAPDAATVAVVEKVAPAAVAAPHLAPASFAITVTASDPGVIARVLAAAQPPP